LLRPDFWTQHLDGDEKLKNSPWEVALGYVASYAALIARESDYHIAIANHLIPAEITWPDWCRWVNELLDCSPESGRVTSGIYTLVAVRFVYGELRLNRLNLIYLCLGYSFMGYLPRWNTYNGFMGENVTLVFAGSAYVVVVLSAMQVGFAVPQLMDSGNFQAASYGFVVFSLLAPLAGIFAVVTALAFGLVAHWRWSDLREKRRTVTLGRSWRAKKEQAQ
jgi:hypothetical protein